MSRHKSQGLSLKIVVCDVGNSIFTYSQTYIALSRVTTLEGLHLINFDPRFIKAQTNAIIEYNRLRKHFKPEMNIIDIARKSKTPKIMDKQWCHTIIYSHEAQIFTNFIWFDFSV